MSRCGLHLAHSTISDIHSVKGGNGYINDYPMGRILRDSRLYTVGAGTQEIRRVLIGREFNEQFKV
jgi:alkylation response protein AidB-like acyl-CoA dehydrogenase